MGITQGKKAHSAAGHELTTFWMGDPDSGAVQVPIFISIEQTLENVSNVLMEVWTSLTINIV